MAVLSAALAWPVVFSSDVYAYAAYGNAVLHAQNPYLAVSHAQHGTFVDAARWQWGGVSFPASVYGPLFIGIAAIATFLAEDRLPATLWMLRIFAAAAVRWCGGLDGLSPITEGIVTRISRDIAAAL